jgi:hypothetical protein
VALAFAIRGITRALAWNADFVSPMVMADGLGTAHGPKEVIFGTYAPLSSLWFNVATRDLPGHRVLWRLAPLLLTILGVAALGWAVWRVAGRWAAIMTVAVGLCGSTPVLTTMLAQANHGASYFVVCLLAAFLVLAATRPATPLVLAAAALLGIAAGINIASDPLLLLVGTGPFLAAAVIGFVRHRSPDLRRVALLAAGVTGLSLAVSVVATRVARASGYAVLGVSQGNPLEPAEAGDLWPNLRRLVGNVLNVFNGDFVGPDLEWTGFGPTTPARVLLAGLTLVAVSTPVVLLVRLVLARRDPAAEPSPSPGVDSGLVVLQIYWGLVVAGLVAGLVLSRLAVENAPRAIGYTTPLFLAVAVAVPIVASRSRRRRALVSVGAALFCGLSLISVVQREIPESYDGFAFVTDSTLLLHVLEREGLHRGYASYGSAAPLTFRSGGRIDVFPVILCVAPDPGRLTLCGFPANRVKAWYTPRPGPSFVIADPTLPWPVTAPPPDALGEPSRVLAAGSQTVFVYPYDVAERFGPTG